MPETQKTPLGLTMIPLEDLHPSPLNPRKVFDAQKLSELAATMGNGVGVIQPITVRLSSKRAGPSYEIIAGERRWRAAGLAKLSAVPAIRKDLTDAQVLEIMVIENDQREDITPLEEGAGFKGLMTFGFNIDALAQRIGRDRRYIYDRVQLLEAIPAVQDLLVRKIIAVGHAIVLSRLTPEVQARAIALTKRNGYGSLEGPLFEHEDSLFTPEQRGTAGDKYAGMKVRTVRELQAWVDEHVRFDPKAPTTTELFPEAAALASAGAKVIGITYAHFVHPDAKQGAGEARVYSVVSWKRADGQAKSKACEHARDALVVAGADRGQAFKACINKDKCRVHWPKEVAAKAARAKRAVKKADKVAGPSASAAEREAAARRLREEEQRKREEAQAVREASVRLGLGALVPGKVSTLAREVMARAILEIFLGDADAEGCAEAFGLTKSDLHNQHGGTAKLAALPAATLLRVLTWAAYSLELAMVPEGKLAAWFSARKVDLKKIEAGVRKAREPKAAAAPKAGTCRFCQCTEAKACKGGCSWVDAGRTVCSTPACVKAAGKADVVITVKATTSNSVPSAAAAGKKKAAKKR